MKTLLSFPSPSFCRFPFAGTAFALIVSCLFLAQTRAETELIPNDKFADDGASWALTAGQGVDATMSIEKVDDEPALSVVVENTTEQLVDVRLQRLFGDVSTDVGYRVTFKAKAQHDDGIVAFVSPVTEGARILWRTEIPLDVDWKEFAFTFKGNDTASGCALGFARLGKGTNKFWFKDIVLSSD